MLPAITISSLDLDRIDFILDTLSSNDVLDTDALANELSRATIVEPPDMPPRTVTMNSTVRFRIKGLDGELRRTLVYPKDASQDDGRLSILTPVGSALLGLSEGDAIQWAHPNGKDIVVMVLEVVYQPERAGDFHL